MQNELFKVTVWLSEDYPRLKLQWTEEVGKEDILILLSMKPINSLNHRDWVFFRRISGLIKLRGLEATKQALGGANRRKWETRPRSSERMQSLRASAGI